MKVAIVKLDSEYAGHWNAPVIQEVTDDSPIARMLAPGKKGQLSPISWVIVGGREGTSHHYRPYFEDENA